MKNAIDFLIEGHGQLREFLAGVGKADSPSEKRQKFTELVRYFYLHEEIETELFWTIENSLQNETILRFLYDSEKLHGTLWNLFHLASEALDSGNASVINRAFDDVDSV